MYLREARLDLGSSLADVLELGGEEPALDLRDDVREKLFHEPFRGRTHERTLAALDEAIRELPGHDGDPRVWLDAVLGELPRSFERACERWRTLYRAAFHQARQQGRMTTDPSRDPRDRDQAKRLRAEAERQLEFLLYRSRDGDLQADFYSYRYFASEGFLPGYSFPRLPLSAYLPGRKSRLSEDDDFLSRPRFLAISEFGPRSIIYHEGSRYEVNRAILPLRDEARPITHRAVQCTSCGYLHILSGETGSDVCEQCDEELPAPYTNLFKMQNASTRRRDRINSDEEERRRLGYEIKTGVRFSERSGRSSRSAVLRGEGGEEFARLELRIVERLGLRLPDDAQVLNDTCRVRPDFFYCEHDLAVFVDGPPHDAPDQQARDDEQQDALETEGYHVLRFNHRADWEDLLRAHPGVFGSTDKNGG